MSAHDWALRVTFDGVEVPNVFECHSSFGRDQPISTCTLTLPLPLPAAAVVGAAVVASLQRDAEPWFPIFTGTYLTPALSYSTDGATATLMAQGPLWRCSAALEDDKAFAGGAREAPVSLSLVGTSLHMGNQTVAWYLDASPDGTTVDTTFTPTADSNFLWLAGRLHGTNSYDASTGDKTIKDHSKAVVLQGGVELGRAFFPESAEQWADQLDYGNDANWSDFELFVACDPPIAAAGGGVTVRFYSGHKPGSSARDEYEVKAVTWQIAGKTSVRNIVRGTLRFCGFSPGEVRCSQITDLSGNVIYLGGNGKVDAGQVRIAASDRPIDFVSRVAGLFGFYLFDRRDGVPHCVPIRGTPHAAPVATFTEGVDAFSFDDDLDAGNVSNAVAVQGASGTGPDGKRFAYAAKTASPAPHPLIPNPPGVRTFPVNDQLLTNNGLCQDVRDVQEDLHDDAFVGFSWEAEPVALDVGLTVAVGAPTVGAVGNLFLVALGYDVDEGGATMRCTGWTGSAATITETDDPDPAEDDAQPTAPRPASEWRRYTPKASVN